ncbi:MAG: peptidoglycan-binding protein [Rhodospirillales bacterium]|nr:peptidoglycan-binding protein [Rhodospirillales bacterium]
MIGKLNWPRPLAAAPSLVKRPVVLAGIAVLVIGVAATGAWLTRPPETAPPRVAKSSKAKRAVVEAPPAAPVAAPATSVVLQDMPPPPQPTSADFARGGPPVASTPAAEPTKPTDWAAMPIDELRTRANTNEIPAMEELARRLVQGLGVTKDQQAGAGWLLRAAQHGSPQSAFNVAVMYERGFVVERDSTKAIEWYRKAVAANLAMAKHNLALLLRDGKGAPRNGKEAVELLRSAALQGMSASMFTLGDIYERGDAAPKDAPTAMAWFAITAEFERQTNRGAETVLAKTATQRTQTLQRILTPAELERAQQLGQGEFKQIVEALSPPKPPPPAATPPVETAAAPAPPPADVDPPGWPTAANDQVRVIQQALVDLKFLRDKPDGAIGPVTRAAIRAFQRSIAMRETGEPTRDVYVALKDSLASRDVVANSPLPPPAKLETPKTEMPTVELPRIELPKVEVARADPAKPAKAEAPKPEPAKVEPPKPEPTKVEPPKPEPAKVEAPKPEPAKAEPPKTEPPKPEPAKPEPPKVDLAKVDPPKPAMPRIDTAKPMPTPVTAAAEPPKAPAAIDIGRPEPAPPPPTSADIARVTPKEAAQETPRSETPRSETPKPAPDAWPTAPVDQVKVVQKLLRDLNFSRDAPDGINGPGTKAAIRDYERAAGLTVTGEPNKALFESLKELRLLMAPKSN